MFSNRVRRAKPGHLFVRKQQALRTYRPTFDVLEDRTTPSAALNFAIIGDYGVASSLLNIPNMILGSPDAEGDISRLVHSWNPDFVVTLGDNNYLCGEQLDAKIMADLELLVVFNKISPQTAQTIVEALASIPLLAATVKSGSATDGSSTITFPAGTDFSELSNGMFVVGPGAELFTTISSIDVANHSITIGPNPISGNQSNEDYHFLPADLSLSTLDGLSHIDRNIGRYFSDFIYPFVPSSPLAPDQSGGVLHTGELGNGSPTGLNRFFPVPGNHDWSDLFSNNNFADSQSLAILSGITGFQLDAYLNYFRQALTPAYSPGFKIGTTINAQNQIVPLPDPYYYSFTMGEASGGRPLIEFFAFDSELADPYLNGNYQGDFANFTNVDTIQSQEGQWLKRAMADSNAVWKIPYFHHTPYSSGGEDAEEGFNGYWMQLPFQQWGADAVLYGHVHNYERLSLKDPAIPALNIPAGNVAIPYLLNGFGGAPPSAFFGPIIAGSQLRYNGDYGAQRVNADENHISFEFINRSGAVIDKSTITQPLIAVGANVGSQPYVKIVNARTGAVVQNILAYEKSFKGGVRVALGDLNGDGMPDLITAPGAGRVGLVKAFDGLTGQAIAGLPNGFTPYGSSFKGGVYVAAGELNGQPGAEIIVSPSSGAFPVAAFTRTGVALPGFTPFFPYGSGFTKGFTVAAGNTNGAGVDEIITAPKTGVGSVIVSNFQGAALLSVSPFGSGFAGGVFVAAGDIDGDGFAEIFVGPASSAQPVRILNGQNGNLVRQFNPYGGSYKSGIRLGVLDFNHDGKDDLIVARGASASRTVNIFDPNTLLELKSFAFGGTGAFVAG